MKQYVGRGHGGPRVQELLSPWFMDVFAHLEVPQTPYYWDVYRGFLMGGVIISSPSPL